MGGGNSLPVDNKSDSKKLVVLNLQSITLNTLGQLNRMVLRHLGHYSKLSPVFRLIT